jgi:hypothetical protein
MRCNIKKYLIQILSISFLLILSSCATIGRVGLNQASNAVPPLIDNVMQLDNSRITKEGLPGLILLVCAIIEFTPENLNLLSTASLAYMSYGLMVEDEDPDYASALYLKGKEYGMRALMTHKKLKKQLDNDVRLIDAISSVNNEKYTSAVFTTAMSWGLWTFLNLEDATAPIGLPTILKMVDQSAKLDDSFFWGGADFFRMAYNCVMPEFAGGGPKKAKAALDKCLSFSNGEMMLPLVYYAKFYARPYGDRKLFHDLLTKAVNYKTNRKDLKLVNELAKKKALHLLKQEEEFFKYE